MKVMIVGENGQLGTTLVRTAPPTVTVHALDLPAFDITDGETVRKVVQAEQPDVIVNASAYTAVDRAEEEAALAFRVNAEGPLNLANIAKERGVRLIHVSTDYVFDGTACTPYAPQAECKPLGIYGKSKREGECHVLETMEAPVIIRTAWLYSQYGNNFVKTMLRLIKEKPELRIVADQVGAPTWAGSLAGAIWKMVAKSDLKGIFHWTDAGVASWYDFAVAISEEAIARGMIERQVPIHPIATEEYPTLTTRPAYSVLDCTASYRSLDITPLQWRVVLRQMMDAHGG